jgi:hypothetical protein
MPVIRQTKHSLDADSKQLTIDLAELQELLKRLLCIS